jgi:Tfp pilus assembly protein PilF
VVELDLAVVRDPAHARAYWVRAAAKRELGDNDGAKADHATALALDPGLAGGMR